MPTDTTAALNYGAAPEVIAEDLELDLIEYMHVMYMPMVLNEGLRQLAPGHLRLPVPLRFARPLTNLCVEHEARLGHRWRYVYLTARRGWATPGNPLNRPGMHSDGFGTQDVNYVWTDRWPTDFVVGKVTAFVGEITPDHRVSMDQFEQAARIARYGADGLEMRNYPDRALLRLTPEVIHAAPEIPAPGGERSFVKVSFSNDRYDLLGNTHNYLLDYDWPMHPRGLVRNDPATAAADTSAHSSSNAGQP